VIEAAAACIAEEGFAAAHANRITELADVSWRVLQYHFGDKVEVLSAVLERGVEGLAAAEVDGESLCERLSAVVDAGWKLFRSPLARAATTAPGVDLCRVSPDGKAVPRTARPLDFPAVRTATAESSPTIMRENPPGALRIHAELDNSYRTFGFTRSWRLSATLTRKNGFATQNCEARRRSDA